MTNITDFLTIIIIIISFIVLFLFLQVVFGFGLDQGQMVAVPDVVLQEHGGTAALELAVGDDGNAVPQNVRFVHVVGGQQNCASW